MSCLAFLSVLILTLVVSTISASAAPPAFTKKPEAVTDAATTRISFAVSQPTDVAVFIDDANGAPVRHLAAGLLGPNAPPPFKPDSLDQSLTWDGTGDDGKPVAPGKYSVRVGLGTTASLDRVIGHERQWLGAIHGLAADQKGGLFALCSRGVCVLDRDGKYLRQIVPAPASMTPDKLSGREPVILPDGSPFYTKGYALPGSVVGSIGITPDGDLVIPGPPRYARNITVVAPDGSLRSDAFSKRLTRLSDDGYLNLACSPDGKAVYASSAEAGYRGDDARTVSFRQSVYKLLLDTEGPAETFTGDDENSGGPGFSVHDPKGLAVDPDGRVYVCNYGRNDVSVYTPGAGLVRTIAVKRPQLVAVHPKTRQVYVLGGAEEARSKYGYDYPALMKEAKLYRFSADGKQELEIEIEKPYSRSRKDKDGKDYTSYEFRITMAADFGAAKPIIWLGLSAPDPSYCKWALLRIEDLGTEFGKPQEAMPKPPAGSFADGVSQIILDRKRDILYLNDGGKLVRYSGDGKKLDPSFRAVDPKSGKKLSICEAALAPDGTLYLLTFIEYGYANNTIHHFDLDGKVIPFAAAPDGAKVTHVMKGGSPASTRGFCADSKGNMYVLHYDDNIDAAAMPEWDRSYGLHTALAKVRADGTMENPRLIAHFRSGAQCVRVDRDGNIYVADNTMPLGAAYPADLAAVMPDPLKRSTPARLANGDFDPILRHYGSVFKFGPEGGKIVGLPEDDQTTAPKRPAGDTWKPAPDTQWLVYHTHRLKMTGALWQYHGIAPIPAQYQGVTHVERCVCRAARFDLDQFGRVFVPDTFRGRVTVLDGAGNVVTRFGRSDNQDAKTSGATGAEIGLVSPGWLAAASDRCYVADGSACRIVRVRLAPSAQESCPVTR